MSELPEVARLSPSEAKALLFKGFEELLGLRLENSQVYERILHSTDRIAQYLHDLGLEIARIARRNNDLITDEGVREAERLWLQDTISSSQRVIKDNMNSFETKAGRRNQVIYSIGLIDSEEFRHTEIEAVIRREFPESAKGSLNLWQILSDLSNDENPLLRRNPKGVFYRVIDPKVKIAIRLMLEKTGEKVVTRFGVI